MSRPANAAPQQTYLVEHYRPELDEEELEHFAQEARRVLRALELEGQPVRFVRSLIVPGDESCLSVVEAASEQFLSEAYARAGIPFERISQSRVLSDSETE